MSLSIKSFETFILLYEKRSLREVARTLGITQPTVTYRIQELEAFLGQKLINSQNNRKLTFTEYGDFAYQELTNIVEKLTQLAQNGKAVEEKRQIKISSGEIAGLYFLPTVIKNFRDKYSDIDISLEISSSLNVVKSLSVGKADIGFIATKEFPELKEIESRIKIEKLLPVELVIITPLNHPFSKAGIIEPLDLVKSRVSFISRSNNSAIQYEFNRILREAGIKMGDLNTVQNFENSSSVISAVAEGLGVAVVSWYQAFRFINAGLVDFAKISTNVKSYIYGLDRWNGRFIAINNFIAYTRSYLGSLSRQNFSEKNINEVN